MYNIFQTVNGEVPERLNGLVSKASIVKAIAGSNPALSAQQKRLPVTGEPFLLRQTLLPRQTCLPYQRRRSILRVVRLATRRASPRTIARRQNGSRGRKSQRNIVKFSLNSPIYSCYTREK